MCCLLIFAVEISLVYIIFYSILLHVHYVTFTIDIQDRVESLQLFLRGVYLLKIAEQQQQKLRLFLERIVQKSWNVSIATDTFNNKQKSVN